MRSVLRHSLQMALPPQGAAIYNRRFIGRRFKIAAPCSSSTCGAISCSIAANMKTLITSVILLTTTIASAGNFFSYVVKPSDQSIRITVQNHRYIKILTFTVDTQSDCTQIPQGLSCNGVSIKAQIGGQPAVTIADGPLTAGKELYVTGPAYVTVTTNTTQTLFLTTFQDSN
jgi:hypothetical protein